MAEEKDKQNDIASKLFDETQYSSMFVHTEEAIKKHQDQIKNLIDILTKDKYKGDRNELFQVLQSEKAGIHLIFDAIESKEGKKHHIALLAAIWESGADASEYITELVSMFMEVGIEAAIELFTVITNNCENTVLEDIEEALDIYKQNISKISADKKELALEILDWLETQNKSFQS